MIDWNKVDNYLKAQCDGVGIAGIIGIHPNTLYEACEEQNKMSFSEYAALKKGEGRELLRAKQFQSAMEGDKTMQIWLGKQYLGQKDSSKIEHGGSIKTQPFYALMAEATAEMQDGDDEINPDKEQDETGT